MKFKRNVLAVLAMLCTLPLSSSQAFATEPLVMIVGDVLPLKNQVVWRNLVRLSERKPGDHLVIAAAHDRPQLYGGFTLRAYQRYGKEAELIPLAIEFQEFSTDFRYLTQDADLSAKISGAGSLFFVGGKPQRLSEVLIQPDGKPTKLASAVREAYAQGSLIVGGIPGRIVVSTDVDPLHALLTGELTDAEVAVGLNLLDNNWYIDQHYFGRGRFVTSLVAMHQFGMQFGVGVGLDTAAVVHGNTVEVIGNRGVMTINLAEASFSQTKAGLQIKNVRLSYLENGDRIDMESGSVTPFSDKASGFKLDAPPEVSAEKPIPSSREMLSSGEFVRLMTEAIESKSGQALGYALHHDNNEEGFEFRFFTRANSRGWLSVEGDQEGVTLENIYLDIKPL